MVITYFMRGFSVVIVDGEKVWQLTFNNVDRRY